MPSRPLRPRTPRPTADKVFLGTTPFPDVINAISCARPLSREGGRPPVAQSLPTPRTCLYDDVPASQGLKFYEKRIKQVIKSSGIGSDLASRLKSRNNTSIFFYEQFWKCILEALTRRDKHCLQSLCQDVIVISLVLWTG